MARRALKDMQPVGVGTTRPPRKPKRTKSKGTLSNPYVRLLDGVEMVKVTFSLSKVALQQLQQYELKLKSEGIGRNTWIEALIGHGIDTGFMGQSEPSAPPPATPSEPEDQEPG